MPVERVAPWVGPRIQEKRAERGMSRSQLAKLLRIDVSVMGRIERNEVGVTVDRLVEIAGHLSCSPESLVAEAAPAPPIVERVSLEESAPGELTYEREADVGDAGGEG